MPARATTEGRALAAGTLQRFAAADLLTQDLREQILRGTLKPGDPLRESELARAYGVARNTVREALRLLTRDGLAVHEVHRGVAVRSVSADEIRDIFGLRRIVEEAAAERAGTLTTDEIGRLEGHLRDSEEAFSADDAQVGVTENLEFHRELVALVGNRRLDELFDQLLTEVRLILATMEDRSGGPWIERNRELLQLLLDGDAARFRGAMRQYLADARDDATP